MAAASDAASGMEALLLMQAPVVDDGTAPAAGADAALGELVAHGLVTSDGFSGLRALLAPANRRNGRGYRRRHAVADTEANTQR